MDERAIRKKVCDQIERDMVDMLERLAKAAPNQAGGLFGVSVGMLKVLADARTPPSSDGRG